jgi:hypothetical protein
MTQAKNAGFRVLARDIAEELTADEMTQVGGATCTETGKVTSPKAGESKPDWEVSISCTF